MCVCVCVCVCVILKLSLKIHDNCSLMRYKKMTYQLYFIFIHFQTGHSN